MDYDGLSVNLWANLRWIPIIVYFKVPNSLKKEPFKNTLDTEEYEGFHIIRFSTHCKDAKKYAHTNIIITSTWEWKWSFTDEQLGFFPRVYSFRYIYYKRYATLHNWSGHYSKIPANYTATMPEPKQNIGETQFGKPYFPLFLTNQKKLQTVTRRNMIKCNDNNTFLKNIYIS